MVLLSGGLGFRSVYAELNPAVKDQVAEATVLIVALVVEMRDGVAFAEAWREPLGSGVLVSDDGLILTNSHVIDLTILRGNVESAENALGVDLEIEDEFLLYVVGSVAGIPEPEYSARAGEAVDRPAVDVAVLRITGDERGFALRRPIGQERSPVDLAPPMTSKPSGELHIFGYPFFGSDALGDLERRTIATVDGTATSLDSGPGIGNIIAIHIDATISNGSSGGPVVNDDGNLVGIMAQVRGGAAGGSEAIAIPVNRIRPVLAEAGWVEPVASPEPVDTPSPTATPTPTSIPTPTAAPTATATSTPPGTSSEPVPQTGNLRVFVKTGDGAPLGGACLELGGQRRSTVCDNDDDDGDPRDGAVLFAGLPAGTYVVNQRVAAAGFGAAQEAETTIVAGKATNVTLTNARRDVPISPEEPTRAPEPVLFSDNFDEPAASLLSHGDFPADVRHAVENGSYAIEIQPSSLVQRGLANLPGTFFDSAMTVDIRLSGETRGWAVELLCRGNPSTGANYSLWVDPSTQSFSLNRMDGWYPGQVYPGQFVMLANGVSDAIRPAGEVNRLTLDCTGDTVSASANATPLASVQDYALDGGLMTIGVVAVTTESQWTRPKAVFDNLVVYDTSVR